MGVITTSLILFGIVAAIIMFFTQGVKSDDQGSLGDIRRSIASFFDYAMNKQNPLCLIFYAVIVYGGFFGYFSLGYPWLANDDIERYTSWLVVAMCLASFYLAVNSDPGYVTKESFSSHAGIYKYDNTLYFPGQSCSTCNLSKLARSKHCRICNQCVARFDHHCVWINNCVGAGNYGRFMFFLGSHAMLLTYGTFVLGKVMLIIMNHYGIFTATYRDPSSGMIKDVTYRMMFNFMLRHHMLLTGLMLLMLGMGIVISIFFLYHVRLACTNSTTNERMKRTNLLDWVSFQSASMEDKKKKMEALATCAGCDVSSLSPFSTDKPNLSSTTKTACHESKQKDSKNSKTNEKTKLADMPTDISSNTFIPSSCPIITEGLDATLKACPPITDWSVEYWKISVETNIYDRGMWKNLGEVLRRPSISFVQSMIESTTAKRTIYKDNEEQIRMNKTVQVENVEEEQEMDPVARSRKQGRFNPLADDGIVGCAPR